MRIMTRMGQAYRYLMLMARFHSCITLLAHSQWSARRGLHGLDKYIAFAHFR